MGGFSRPMPREGYMMKQMKSLYTRKINNLHTYILQKLIYCVSGLTTSKPIPARAYSLTPLKTDYAPEKKYFHDGTPIQTGLQAYNRVTHHFNDPALTYISR